MFEEKEPMTVAYSNRKEYWRDFGERRKLSTIIEFKKILNEEGVQDICFISDCGMGFRTKKYNGYQFDHLTPQLLEGLAEGQFFDKDSNSKMWFCCLKYAINNKECIDFWNKYKETDVGPKFMALILGQK